MGLAIRIMRLGTRRASGVTIRREAAVKQYVGLDVSDKETSVCVVDETGRPVWQGRCLSAPETIAAAIPAKAPHAERVGLETGPLSTWHWHGLKAFGLPVVCLDPRHAKAALSLQTNKTDANDALGLAQIVRTGWYREVQIKTMDAHLARALIVARAELVVMHRDLSNQVRGVLKVFGLVVGHISHGGFGPRVRELVQGGPDLWVRLWAPCSRRGRRPASSSTCCTGACCATPERKTPADG